MQQETLLFIMTIIMSFIFEFTNGFHDAANVVSTVIATKVLRPLAAIIMASCLNFLGATQISHVVTTLTQGVIPYQITTQSIIMAALFGAIVWNILTWYLALPSSSSYALIGGLIGAGIAGLGIDFVLWESITKKVIIPMIFSPLIGFLLSFLIMKIFMRLISKKIDSGSFHIFGKLQMLSAAFVAISHGFNDAQKTMAIITLALFSKGSITTLAVPLWVIVSCALVMALGTASGGYRIIQTVAFKISKLQPVQGFVAESTSSCMICLAAFLGFPLSTTQLIVGSIGGVGASSSFKNICFKTSKKIIYAWIITIPGSMIMAVLFYKVLKWISF
jgi:PiT family inorganic phosphate transporter